MRLAALVLGTYSATTLAVWLGHWLPHRARGALREFHLGGHHALYPDSLHARGERFRYGKGRHDSLVPLLPWLAALVALEAAALGGSARWIAFGETAALAAGQALLHEQFHLARTPLARFAWFRRARAAHDLHHDRDVNFMVGDLSWDRAFGTFAAPPAGAVERQ